MSKKTTFDFGDGGGPVPAHRHKNPDGTKGGWVADTATVEPSAFVREGAMVYGHAMVRGCAFIGDQARVYGCAMIFDRVRVLERARVCGYATMLDAAEISGAAVMRGGSAAGESKFNGDALIRGREIAWGRALDFSWTTWLDSKGARVLRFGCETHPLSNWTRKLRWQLSKRHIYGSSNVKLYANTLRHLVRLCKSMPGWENES